MSCFLILNLTVSSGPLLNPFWRKTSTRPVALSFPLALMGRQVDSMYVKTLYFSEAAHNKGVQGASKLAEYLLSTYGENSFALLVDEGGKLIAHSQ